jgi:NAD(P)-dependent dehydrogenase (short-subunit alcohol dehydrogenase family)
MGNTLSGKNIIITGASRGLGAYITKAMWHEGANLLLVARSKNALEDLYNSLQHDAMPHQKAGIAVADLTDPDAISHIMNEVQNIWQNLHVLVNNAGILGPVGPVWENNWEQWQETLRVNLLAPIALCRACVPWMKRGGGGKIINLSGGGATGPRPNFSAYAVSKTGIVRFTEILAQEVREANIWVNSVAPGALKTDMLRAIVEAGPQKGGAKDYHQALKHLETEGNDLEQAAALCVFLASAASDGITGKLISAVWDPWRALPGKLADLQDTDIYTLRRILPRERDKDWG